MYRPEYMLKENKDDTLGLMQTCKCDIPASLRCVNASNTNRGKYFWSCERRTQTNDSKRETNQNNHKEGCNFFAWLNEENAVSAMHHWKDPINWPWEKWKNSILN